VLVEQTDQGPKVVGASDELLLAQLAEIDEFIRAFVDRDVVLANGFDGDAVERALDSVSLPTPSEVRIWFGWANGGAVGLPTLPLPASLDDALLRYPDDGVAMEAAHTAGYDDTAEMWGAPEGWLRLQSSNNAIAVECAVPVDARPRLRVASVDLVDVRSVTDRTAVSLCSVAELCLVGFRAGAFAWDASRRRWRIDVPAFRRERERMGWPPGSLF
jgi:hypothetical protein